VPWHVFSYLSLYFVYQEIRAQKIMHHMMTVVAVAVKVQKRVRVKVAHQDQVRIKKRKRKRSMVKVVE